MFSIWLRQRVARLLRWVHSSAAYRDGALVVGAILYGIGYIVWSWHAWWNGFGLLPILSTQFVVTGFAMGLFLLASLVVLGTLLRSRSLLHYWICPLPKDDDWIAKSIRRIITSIAIVCALVFFLQEYINISDRQGRIAVLAFAVAAFYTPKANNNLIGWWFGTGYAFMFAIMIPVAGVLIASEVLYMLPEQFGGLSTSCVHLDIDRSKLSKETQNEVFPPIEATPGPAFARTIKLDILFSNSDSTLVRRHNDVAGPKPRRIYDISPKIITSRADCD